LTQAIIYKFGSLARSADVRVARVKTDMPWIIHRAIEKALAPSRDRVSRCEGLVESHGLRLDTLTARIEAQDKAKVVLVT